MTIVLPVLGVAFAAFCVWLGVRIVNRRERWAKWTLVAALLLAYPLSLGPAMALGERSGDWTCASSPVYVPLMLFLRGSPRWVVSPYFAYLSLCMGEEMPVPDDWGAD